MLTEAGLPDLTTLTGLEIVELTGTRFGPDPAGHAGEVNAAAGAAAYSTAVLIGPEDADSAWAAERLLRRQVNQQLSPRERLTAWLRYHRTRPVRLPSGPESWALETERRVEARKKAKSKGRHRRH